MVVPVLTYEACGIKSQHYGIRCDFKYTFEDGRIHFIRSVRLNDELEAELNMLDRVDSLNERYRRLDAIEAVELGIVSAHKDATQDDVLQAYSDKMDGLI